MAITTTTISKSAGWARTDVLYQLEEAFTWLGWNGDTITGIVTGISDYSGGGTVGSSGTDYHEVFPVTTTGIGTGASFYVQRSSGTINTIRVNRPGVGYTSGEYVTLSAEDIGGSANGATGIGITVLVAGGGSPVGYGSTTQFFSSNISGTYPWGVVRHTIESNKKFGDTYRGFQSASNTTIYIVQGSGFHPWTTRNLADKGNMYETRFAGTRDFDIGPLDPDSSNIYYSTSSLLTGSGYLNLSFTIADSTSYQLDLNIYRSSLDPNFAVFSYRHPDLSSTKINDNNFDVFFFHNFTTSLWDYDYLFLGGMTKITSSTSGQLEFRTYLPNEHTKRSAEWGYSGSGYNGWKDSNYESASIDQSNTDEISFYYRTEQNSSGGDGDSFTLDSNTFYNAVIKGIPLSTQIAPCPYYLPDDFVLIEFKINTPSVNVQQGDTITISGSEVYTVITASYNQTTTTRGIAFCARTV